MAESLPILLIALVFALILGGIPIYLSLALTGLASLVVLSITTSTPLAFLVAPQSIYLGIGSLPLLAIPLYIFAGEVMNRGGITQRLINLALLIIGRMPASLAQANIVASMFFGGITGSAQADTSCIGGILIPAMINEGYTPDESVAVTASSSVCGPIIPPSIVMVVYATTVGCSIGTMFMAGVVPGLMIGFGLMIVVAIRDRIHHFPRRDVKLTRAEVKQIIVEGLVPLGAPVIIVGGIMSGICSPTEAGVLAVVYSLVISVFVIRTVRLKDIVPMLLTTAVTSGGVFMVMAAARIFSYGLNALHMSSLVTNLILSITQNKYVFLLLVNILLLIMGMFMDSGASVLILAPILTPIAVSMGISPIHFGIIMCLNLIIGCGTPPVGLCLFVACKQANISVERGSKAIMPYILGEVVVLLLVTYIEPISLFLPALLGFTVG